MIIAPRDARADIGQLPDGIGHGDVQEFAGFLKPLQMLNEFEMLAVEATRHLKGRGALHDRQIVDGELGFSLGDVGIFEEHNAACFL